MRRQTIDYFTVAGLAIFVILSMIYLFRNEIEHFLQNLSFDISSPGISIPFSIPSVNLDWFDSMDPASKLIFSFIMTILFTTFIGGTGVYLMRKRLSARR